MSTEASRLRAELKKWRDYFQTRALLWGLTHTATAFGAVIASATVGFIVQRPGTWALWSLGKDDFLTWLALIATILATIAAAGGFERKWRSSRSSRSQVDLLRLDLTERKPDLQAIRTALKRIIANHDHALIGFLRETEESAASGLAIAKEQEGAAKRTPEASAVESSGPTAPSEQVQAGMAPSPTLGQVEKPEASLS